MAKLDRIPLHAAFLQLVAPLALYCRGAMERLGQKSNVNEQSWPLFNREKLVASKDHFQVNGKYRGDAELPNNPSRNHCSKKPNLTEGSRPDRRKQFQEIYVPNKIVNFVVQ